MREEMLEEKLKNIRLPDIQTGRHQSRLRMTLLQNNYLKNDGKVPGKKDIKGVVQIMKNTVKRGLLAEQPIWKTAAISMFAMALVIALSLTLPLNVKSAYAEAEEIAKEAFEVKEALGGGEIQIVRIDISDEMGKVIAKGEKGTVLAEVDLNTKQVSAVAEFTVDEEAAVRIALDDPRVKELIDSGAAVEEVSTMYLSSVTGNYLTGEEEESYQALVIIEISDGETKYVAQVSYPEAKLTGFYETPSADESVPVPVSEGFSISDIQTDE